MTSGLRPLLFVTLLVASLAYAGSPTHCKRGEIAYFSCAVGSSGKVVSVCGGALRSTDQVDDLPTWLQYRFGRLENLELVFPARIKGSVSKFQGEHHQGQTVNSSTVIFRNGGIGYTVGTIHPVGTDTAFDGAIVHRPRKELLWLQCTSRPIISTDFHTLVENLEPAP